MTKPITLASRSGARAAERAHAAAALTRLQATIVTYLASMVENKALELHRLLMHINGEHTLTRRQLAAIGRRNDVIAAQVMYEEMSSLMDFAMKAELQARRAARRARKKLTNS